MKNLTRIGLAAALIIGSASLASAQTYEASPGVETGQPNAAGVYVGPETGRATTHAGRRHAQREAPSYYESQQPWSSSFDPGNTTGGN